MRQKNSSYVIKDSSDAFQEILLVLASYDLHAIHHLLANMSNNLQIEEKIVLKVGQQQLKLTRKQTTFCAGKFEITRRCLRIVIVQGCTKKLFKALESLTTLNVENSFQPRTYF